MEDIIKALLDVVRAQHSATEGTEEEPFNMDDIVDMAMNIVGRPDESEEEAEMVDSIQKMVESLAPDIFPPKTFEEMDDTERAASAVSMIEERLMRGMGGRTSGQSDSSIVSTESETGATSNVSSEVADHAYSDYDSQDEEEEQDSFNPQEAADLNDLIYKNFMQMMGLQDPKVEYPFDRSQIRYGKEKSITEMLEEEKAQEQRETEQSTPPKRQLSAWELAQDAIDKDEAAHEKEPYVPKPMEMPQTKSASQLAAEAIARSQEQDKEKLEIEKQAERLMEEAKKRGQDPMKFALHQQEILQYMEKNSDELVSFEDYEDLSPEEKYEIERQIHIEKQLAAGVAPEDVNEEVPPEFIPKELVAAHLSSPASEPSPANAANESQQMSGGHINTAPQQRQEAPPILTEEMLRQLSQEVIRENSDMILSENENEDMDSLNEAIFENIKRMMSGSGTEVEKEDVGDLLEQVTASNKNNSAKETIMKEAVTKDTPASTEENAVSSKGLSAVELAMAAQKAAKPEPTEVKETKSAVEMAREAFQKEQEKKAAESKEAEEESIEDLLNDDFDDLEIEDNVEEESSVTQEQTETLMGEDNGNQEPEKNSEENIMSDEDAIPEQSEEEKDIDNELDIPEDFEEEEEYEYVDPDELVLGEHTQAEIDEAMENLATLGLEGDVYERAKRMLLLELAGSEAELDAWLKEQEGSKKKKAAVSALDGEDHLGDLTDFDEEDLEKELELAMDEDFLTEEEIEEEPEDSETAEEGEEEIRDSETAGKTEEEPEDSETAEEAGEEIEDSETSEEDSEGIEDLETSEEDTEEIEVSGTQEDINEKVSEETQRISEETENEEEHVSELEVDEVVPAPKMKSKKSAQSSVKHSRAKKKVVRKKEKPAPEPKKEKKIPDNTEAEEKGYQVSVRKPFVLKNSASFMNQFEEYIVDTQENRKLSTGFKKLDAMLRYGLHKGSYFIDSQPQYLKNSFMQQIADRAAEAGIDVLYISTELSRYDLMVDTISRLSYEIHQGDLDKAVSVMSIMTGEDGADIGSLKDELNWYRGRISEHLFILDQEAVTDYVDSMEESSAGEILEELIRSIVREGAHKPVVFIDNIENILSVEDSEDMKPLMDGIRKLSKELGIPIVMSYGYEQAESEEEMDPADLEFHESIGNMCDVYLELKYADMITEDSMEITEEDIRDMVEEGDTLLIDVLLHKNRRPMRASCQIQGTPKYNYFEE